MVVFGQNDCIPANWLFSVKVVVFGHIGFVRSKVVVFWLKWIYSAQSACIEARWLYSGTVVAFGQNLFYSGKMVVFGQKWL